MIVAALIPLLVDDKLGAGRPPFGEKFVFVELPMVAFVADTQRKRVAATPFTNLCLVAQVAVEASSSYCFGSSPRLYRTRELRPASCTSRIRAQRDIDDDETRWLSARAVSTRLKSSRTIFSVVERIRKNRKPEPRAPGNMQQRVLNKLRGDYSRNRRQRPAHQRPVCATGRWAEAAVDPKSDLTVDQASADGSAACTGGTLTLE
jgi:hypothetical protein